MEEVSFYCKEIENKGYTIVKNLFDKEDLDGITRNLDYSYHSEELETNYKRFHGEAKVINNLQAKSIEYWKYISHPFIEEVCELVLNKGSYNEKEGYSLTGAALRTVYGKQAAQQLHIDSNLPGCNYILTLQFCIPLNEFTAINGATQILKGSQYETEYAPENRLLTEEQRERLQMLTADVGDLIIFNGGVWHGSSEKLDDTSRSAMFLSYSRWFMKQSYDIANNIPKGILKKLNNNQLRIAGCYYQPPFDEDEGRGRKSDRPIIREYK